MSKLEKIKELERLQDVAGIRKSICETVPLIGNKIRILKNQFDKLRIEEQNLIRAELTTVLNKNMHMTYRNSHNLYIEMTKPILGFSFPRTHL
jgi:hypothetical protein